MIKDKYVSHPTSYKSRRSRGLVWVCDVASSSRLLNRNDTAEATELFLERFLHLALSAVNAGGGTFVKWTGDGFLAFFETPLDRAVGETAATIFEAAWWLTILVNVTQLCSPSKERFRIRHAVTYEKDALLIDLRHSGDMKSKDVLGRSVVAAFRLSGISCEFPHIVTHREILRAIDDAQISTLVSFKANPLTAQARERFFKGEVFGTRDVYVSANRLRRKRRSIKAIKRSTTQLLDSIQKGSELNLFPFRKKFFDALYDGPTWYTEMLEVFAQDFLNPAFDTLLESTKNPPPINFPAVIERH